MRLSPGSAVLPRPVTFFLLIVLSAARSASAQDPGSAEDLSRYVATALAENPELKASDARWRMYREKVAQAGSFDDPMLTLAIRNGVATDPFDFGKEPMTGKVIGLSQRLPFWGKRALREEMAAKTADSYRWTLEERRLDLARMVKETWYRIYYIDRSIEIVDKNIRILDDFITLAETRYSVNRGSQTDILKAQVERSKLLAMRIALEQQRKTAQADLNALLYRPADLTVGRIPDFELTPVTLTTRQLRELAYENRPQIRSLAARIGKAEAGLKLADREFYPDFNVFAEYTQRDRFGMSSGNDLYSLGVSINLPVQRARRQAAIAASNSEIGMAAEELNGLKNSIYSGIVGLLAQLEKRRKLAELYRNAIIPQADQTLESASINYRVDKVDFLTLLDSQMTLFNYERVYYESLADYQAKLADLEALVGKELQ